jgi:hypothetical protein
MMAIRDIRNYECDVVHKQVQIYLKHQKRGRIEAHGPTFSFVQCNQGNCQHVDQNELPCPLNAGIFSESVEVGVATSPKDGERLCRW